MHVRIDKTGEDILTGRVDDLGAFRNLQVFTDFGNRLVFDVDVGLITLIGGDDVAVFG